VSVFRCDSPVFLPFFFRFGQAIPVIVCRSAVPIALDERTDEIDKRHKGEIQPEPGSLLRRKHRFATNAKGTRLPPGTVHPRTSEVSCVKERKTEARRRPTHTHSLSYIYIYIYTYIHPPVIPYSVRLEANRSSRVTRIVVP
jgi:hypothetical protein